MKRIALLTASMVAFASCWPFDFDQLERDRADAGAMGGGSGDSGTTGGGSATGGGSDTGGGSAPGGGTGSSTGGGTACVSAPVGGGFGTLDGGESFHDGGCDGFGLNGWCWESPGHPPNSLAGVFSRGPDDTWFAGAGGLVMHWNGQRLESLQVGARFPVDNSFESDDLIFFRGLAGDARRVVAVGTHAQVYEFLRDGGIRGQTVGTDAPIRAVSLSPTGRACIGTEYGDFACDDGDGNFSPLVSLEAGLRISSVLETNRQCFVAGNIYGATTVPTLLTCDGTTLASEAQNEGQEFDQLWAVGEEAWLAAHIEVRRVLADGGMQVIDAGVRAFDPSTSLKAGIFIPDAGFFGGGFGTLMKSQTGLVWERDQVGLTNSAVGDIAAIHGTTAQNLWAVGDYGVIHKKNASQVWQRFDNAAPEYSVKDAFVSNQVQLMFSDGWVSKRTASSWARRSASYTEGTSLWCSGAYCSVLAKGSGADGARDPMDLAVSRNSGTTWQTGLTISGRQFGEQWFDVPSNAFMIGETDSLWRGSLDPVDAANFSVVATGLCPTPNILSAIHGYGNDVYAVGATGCILHVVGGSCVAVETTGASDLVDVWTVDGNVTWAVSRDSVFRRQDGQWTQVSMPQLPGTATYESVWANSDVTWIVGKNYLIHSTAGGGWQREFPGIGYSSAGSADFQLTRVRGNAEGVYVFGTSGTILFKRHQ